MDLLPYLKLMVERQASDLFFTANAPVNVKIEGVTEPIGHTPLVPGTVKLLAYSVLSDEQVARFEQDWELNTGLSVPGLGRFRINVFRQRGEVAMVVRFLRHEIPELAALHLPPILERLVMAPRGLVLVVGATGSGKSTTLASMIDYRNRRSTGHILTVEDPLEYLHENRKSIVDQREVGLDTHSYADALKNAMREAPDVIMIGEVRDRQTMQHAIAYAETGHLCLTTLHASNANQALERIVNFFPHDARDQLFMDLSLHLSAVIAQRLLVGVDGKRVPAVEVMLNSPYVSQLIRDGEIHALKEAIEQGGVYGMQTLDQSLYRLYREGRVALEEALRAADSRNDLSLRIRLDQRDPVGLPESTGLEE